MTRHRGAGLAGGVARLVAVAALALTGIAIASNLIAESRANAAIALISVLGDETGALLADLPPHETLMAFDLTLVRAGAVPPEARAATDRPAAGGNDGQSCPIVSPWRRCLSVAILVGPSSGSPRARAYDIRYRLSEVPVPGCRALLSAVAPDQPAMLAAEIVEGVTITGAHGTFGLRAPEAPGGFPADNLCRRAAGRFGRVDIAIDARAMP